MPLLVLLNWVITLPTVGRIHEMPPTLRVPVLLVLVAGGVVVVVVLVDGVVVGVVTTVTGGGV